MLLAQCAYIVLWMHLESLESTEEARVALGYRIYRLEQLSRFFHVLHSATSDHLFYMCQNLFKNEV